jgi:hypothetical protein
VEILVWEKHFFSFSPSLRGSDIFSENFPLFVLLVSAEKVFSSLASLTRDIKTEIHQPRVME